MSTCQEHTRSSRRALRSPGHDDRGDDGGTFALPLAAYGRSGRPSWKDEPPSATEDALRKR
jgi:hypothetical protein